MRDPDIVAAIVAGDPAGLAAAYETYAPTLYTYCRSLLRDPDEAADALHDTFVVASQKLDGLRDPERLRPWLYAVARNECLRVLRARTRMLPLEDTDDVSDDSADLTLGIHQQELRDLVRSAFGGLNASDREVLDLSMRHELNGPELGAALGVSANHAHALLSRARGQLEVALGALLVARSGSADCAELAELLGDWNGHFSTLIRKRVNRHIEACDTCRNRRSGELRPAMLLGLGPILLPPPEVRARILRLFAHPAPGTPTASNTPAAPTEPTEPTEPSTPDGPKASETPEAPETPDTPGAPGMPDTPEAAAQRTRIARRAEPFDLITGFPIPLARRRRAALRRRAAVSTALALLLLLIGATAASAALHMGPFHQTADHKVAVLVVTSPTTAATLIISVEPTPTPDLTTTSHSPTASPTPSPSTTSATPEASTSTYLVVTPTSASPTPTPPRSTTPPPSRSPTPPRSSSPPPPSPSVSVTGNPVRMDGPGVTGHFQLTAEGGTVNYTITLPSNPDMYGDPTVSPASGTLAAGQSVIENIRITDGPIATTATFDLTVNPGDIQISVSW